MAVFESEQWKRMTSGELYHAYDPLLVQERERAHDVCWRFNQTRSPAERRALITGELGLRYPETSPPEIEPTFQCDYGVNISVGANFYCNFNCVILDCATVQIGDNCLLAPGVQIYTAGHPVDARTRATGLEFARPVTIGDDCWIGGNAVICPGVTLGHRVVVGAGAVVTKSFGDDVLVAGSPARVLRDINVGQVE